MYSLDCTYYTSEFDTLEELIEDITINGMDPNYEVTKDGVPQGENAIDFISF